MHLPSILNSIFPLVSINISINFPPSACHFLDNQSKPYFIEQRQLQKEVIIMAIIRILVQVRQQQLFGTHYIELERQRLIMERQTQPADYRNEQEEHREQSQGDNRNQQRRQIRRQIHMLHNPTQQQHEQQVPEDVQPFLNMMQLEETNRHSLSNQSLAHLNPTYKTIHPYDLSARLQPPQPTSTAKQTIYEKILIYGIVWHKDINGLFDYEEKDKNEKSSIVIEDDVRSHINFVEGQEGLMPREDDVFLVIFKTKSKRVIHEKMLLRDVRITALKRHLPNSKEVNQKGQKYNDNEFLCAFKLVMNNVTNQFTIKVYSFDELSKQVKLMRRKSLSEEKKERIVQLKQNSREIQNSQTQKKQHEKSQLPKEETNQSINCLNPLNFSQEQASIHQPYFIIRTLSKNSPQQSLGYKLYPGDMIKLGKVQYKVISIDGVSIEDQNSEFDRRALQVTQMAKDQEQEIQCKYCLGGKSQEENNFFVHLCDCRGHIGYVHYNCLTTWTTTRASVDSAQNVKIYYLEKMKCEVCTKEFPKYFRYNSKLYYILPIDLPEKHVMLVDVSQKQDATTAVITGVEGKSTILGRGRNAQLRVTDITVSREHASITRFGDNYYIKDMKSKFGTLVRSSEREIETEIEYKKGFQISNVIFTIQIIKREIQKQQQPQKQSQKVLNSQKIKQEKAQFAEENDSLQNKPHKNNNSFSTIFKRNSDNERHPNSSFDLEKLNPQADYRNIITEELIKQTQMIKQEIKILYKKQENNFGSTRPRIVEENDEKANEQQEQTRTSKRPERRVSGVNVKGYNQNSQYEDSFDRRNSIQRYLHKKANKRDNMNSHQQESEQIELENDQNTRNIHNNNTELIPSESDLKIVKRTLSKRISFEQAEQNEHSSN